MKIAASNRKTLKTWFRNKSTASKTFKEMAVSSTESQRAIQDTRLIPSSALQHYIFCLHQCALIHNEQAWAENYLTTQEKALYERGDSGEQETCKDVRFERAVHVLAEKLGIRQRAGLGGTGSEDRQPGTRGIQTRQAQPRSDGRDPALCLRLFARN